MNESERLIKKLSDMKSRINQIQQKKMKIIQKRAVAKKQKKEEKEVEVKKDKEEVVVVKKEDKDEKVKQNESVPVDSQTLVGTTTDAPSTSS